ncbi:MAG: succinyl-diaminopimelate desuccinylase [Pseudomonadota bacterium]|nr:succinyl-diaminopimelate desuccinylase [Pseudomonadota bacterium]
MQEKIINILEKLVSYQSITPNDEGCQDFIANYLQDLGFGITKKKYDDVDNLIAKKGFGKPIIAFAGHTDVVPAGDVEKWNSNPFKLTKNKGAVVGRGVADMKGSIACMLIAIEHFLDSNPSHNGSIVVVLTSDEEGIAINGIKKLIEENDLQKNEIDMCLIGEPTSKKSFGDTIKIGRRGSLSAKVKVLGLQGHIAYPNNAVNPIHKVIPVINELTNTEYDKGNKFFPPTSFQISNINSGVGVDNVIPGELLLNFNFRYSPEITKNKLMSMVEDLFNKHGLNYDISWHHSGEPYLSSQEKFLDICCDSIKAILKVNPEISTDGGTSDGRFLAKICNQVIEFGLVNESIHKINENTKEQDLVLLSKIYEKILSKSLS